MGLHRALKKSFAAIGIAVLVLMLAILLVLTQMARHVKALQRDDPARSAPSTGAFVAALDTRLFVQRAGSPDAPAVVFVHGTGSWSESWRASMNAVAGLGYQAVALDLPPFGYSIAPASGDYTKATQGRRILAALDSIGVKRAVFVAHSFGAAPVMEALLREPQRADSLVLIDAALGLDSPQTDGHPNALQSLLASAWLAETISAALLTNPAMTKTLLGGFISEKDRATAAWVSLYQQPLAISGTYRKVAQWLPQLLGGARPCGQRRGRIVSALAISGHAGVGGSGHDYTAKPGSEPASLAAAFEPGRDPESGPHPPNRGTGPVPCRVDRSPRQQGALIVPHSANC